MKDFLKVKGWEAWKAAQRVVMTRVIEAAYQVVKVICLALLQSVIYTLKRLGNQISGRITHLLSRGNLTLAYIPGLSTSR